MAEGQIVEAVRSVGALTMFLAAVVFGTLALSVSAVWWASTAAALVFAIGLRP